MNTIKYFTLCPLKSTLAHYKVVNTVHCKVLNSVQISMYFPLCKLNSTLQGAQYNVLYKVHYRLLNTVHTVYYEVLQTVRTIKNKALWSLIKRLFKCIFP